LLEKSLIGGRLIKPQKRMGKEGKDKLKEKVKVQVCPRCEIFWEYTNTREYCPRCDVKVRIERR
jgi:rubrerythrin